MNTGNGPRDSFGEAWILLALALWPTGQIYKIFGSTLILWTDNQWFVLPLFLVFFINAFLLFLVGTIIGIGLMKYGKKGKKV